MPSPLARHAPLSFWRKSLLAAALVLAADWLFWARAPGSSVGAFALAWVMLLALARPNLLRQARSGLALAAAALFALVLLDRPGLAALALFGLSLVVAALSPRVARGEDAWAWAQRLVMHGLISLAGPTLDAVALVKLRRGRRLDLLAGVRLLALPLLGGLLFFGLFASANPVIADLASRLRLPALAEDQPLRAMFWALVAVPVWAVMRPRWIRRVLPLPSGAGLPSAAASSLILSLVVFNALFAVQNGLDLAFLWSGAPLPAGTTLAEYAHRGAYTLIIAASLPGLFVLVALRPGSILAERPLVRWLVILWVVQTLFLVASSMLRLGDYVEAYALTRLRIAALLWMALVGVGLGLICWRLLVRRSGAWLVNANVAATLAVLAAVSVVDLGAVAATWNVRHAREADGTGAALDLCYLSRLGAPSLTALAELEASTADPALRERATAVRRRIQGELELRQYELRGWIWRDARRLTRAAELAPPAWKAPVRPGRRRCDGGLWIAPASPASPPALTASAGV